MQYCCRIILGSSFIDRCIRGIFFTKQEIFRFHSRPAATITIKKATNSIYANYKVFNVKTNSHNDELNEILIDVCCVARQKSVPAYTQAAVLVSGQSTGLMMIGTHHNVFERRRSMATPGLTDTLLRKPFEVYIVNGMARPINLLNFMIVTSSSSAPRSITHPRDDEQHMLKEGGQDSNAMQRH